MRAFIEPSVVRGVLTAPRSKSHAIRLIMASLIAPTEIEGIQLSGDVEAALRVVEAFGARVELVGDRARVTPPQSIPREVRVHVGGSATTLRIALAIAATLGVSFEVDGDETLRRRPLDALREALADTGVRFSNSRLPLRVEGRLADSRVEIRGSESSQYITGFMIAFCMLGNGEISVVPPLVSKSYVYMTSEVLSLFGCSTRISETKVEVARTFSPRIVKERVWGDYALASFYAVSALTTGGSLTILDLPEPRSYFGDHSIVKIYERMGAVSEYSSGSWRVESRSEYEAVAEDFEDAPDLPLSVAPLAALARGCSELSGVSRLAIKESDRVRAVAHVLRSFGVDVEYTGGALRICGSAEKLKQQVSVQSFKDHRVAMMAAALALRVGGVVEEADSVNKSNPRFWSDLASVGGRIRLE
ncbi:MAG: 3-phosphoshikimate 1-carboxyvinyltransferase [Acidilobaceae archaeon]